LRSRIINVVYISSTRVQTWPDTSTPSMQHATPKSIQPYSAQCISHAAVYMYNPVTLVSSHLIFVIVQHLGNSHVAAETTPWLSQDPHPASHEALLTPPTLPAMSPSPIVPLLTSVPSGHVPRAVVANVCVNTTSTPTVLPPTVWIDITCVTVGDCVGASVATGAPPPGAACEEARESRGRRRRRSVMCIIV
jgi:hypothetical protein